MVKGHTDRLARDQAEYQREESRNSRLRGEEAAETVKKKKVREKLVQREKQRELGSWRKRYEWLETGMKVRSSFQSCRNSKKKRGQCRNFTEATSLSSLATGWMGTEEGSGFPCEDGKAPLALLLRIWPPTCLYAPLVPEDCSCGCSWRFGEEGVDVNTRVLSAVTSACRTSIWEWKTERTGEDNEKLWQNAIYILLLLTSNISKNTFLEQQPFKDKLACTP